MVNRKIVALKNHVVHWEKLSALLRQMMRKIPEQGKILTS